MQNQPFNQLTATKHGLMLVNKNDKFIGKGLLLYGQINEDENNFYKQVCKRGAYVIEVGSNIGVHSLAIARFIGHSGRLFCFEPQRIVYQTLNANLALNSLTNSYTFHQAVGAEAKSVKIPNIDYTKEANYGGFALQSDAKGEDVVQVRLDDALELEHLELLKIDVEGMEAEVIKGASSLIQKHKPLIYCENDRQEKSQALIELLWSLEYECYWHLPALFSVDNFNGIKENIFENLISVNMFCVHKEAKVNVDGFVKIVDAMEHPMKR